MLEILICEDNKEYRHMLIQIIDNLIAENKINGRIVADCDCVKVAKDFIRIYRPNVFLLDIDLNSVETGYDLAKNIKNTINDPYIVFISEHPDYVFKSFKVRAFDFLPKPVSKKHLESVIVDIYSDYLNKIQKENSGFMSIKIGTRVYNLPKSEIILIEKNGNKCIFHSKDNTIYSYDTLDTIALQLSEDFFVRCHKSYIVNMTFIKEICTSTLEIILTNGQSCQMGGKYKKNLLSAISSNNAIM